MVVRGGRGGPAGVNRERREEEADRGQDPFHVGKIRG
jgi:hypothetical protein